MFQTHVTHAQSWVLRHLINFYITYSSTVPLLLSQLLSLFPQEIQPNPVHCSLCSFVDPRGITLHLTQHITFKISLGCPFLSLCPQLHNHGIPLSVPITHFTGLNSPPHDCHSPSPSLLRYFNLLSLSLHLPPSPLSLFLLQSNSLFSNLYCWTFIPHRAHQQRSSRYQRLFL